MLIPVHVNLIELPLTEAFPLVGSFNCENLGEVSLGAFSLLKYSVEIKLDGV